VYQNILVPLDGSAAAEHAIPWALSVARQDDAAIRLVRVHLSPSSVMMVGSEPVSDFSVDGAVRDQEAAYLREKLTQLKAVCRCEVTGELLDGPVTAALLECVKARPTDLVVMTTHGRGALARFWLGSVTDKFIRQATVPTLLIRPHDTAADFTITPFIRHILIPLDGSPLAEQVIEPATRLGQLEGSDYTLLMVVEAVEDIVALAGKHVNDLPPPWKGEYVHHKAVKYLKDMADTLRIRSMRVHTEVIEHGSAAQTILDYVAKHDNPVIAMATRGRTGLSRLVFGSVADKIIRAATTPVMIYHPVTPE
jgi:nucleotide-binding universal stress UspA family protein